MGGLKKLNYKRYILDVKKQEIPSIYQNNTDNFTKFYNSTVHNTNTKAVPMISPNNSTVLLLIISQNSKTATIFHKILKHHHSLRHILTHHR